MIVYRFKVTFENNDDFVREIDLSADQNFFDFYSSIIENLKLDKNLSTAFFLCDHKYRKKKSISLPSEKVSSEIKGEEEEENSDAIELTMDKCHLNEYIDDPHQRFLFIYDIAADWNFYIELIKILPVHNQNIYPQIVKSVGPTPSELVKKTIPLPGEDPTDDDELEESDPGVMDSEEEESHTSASLYDEEDLEDLNDDAFYNESVERGSDSDESK